jgi:hypothetical protein
MGAVEHRDSRLGQGEGDGVVAQLGVVRGEGDRFFAARRYRARRRGEAVAQIIVVADIGAEQADRRVVVLDQAVKQASNWATKSCPVAQASSGFSAVRPGACAIICRDP